jgi:hypothetical protein
MYSYYITSQVGDHGVGCWLDQGIAVDVDGVEHVRMQHGVIVPATQWRDSLAEAQQLAKSRLVEMASRIMQQAAELH